jgi:octaprenyl-diphosphate synthase
VNGNAAVSRGNIDSLPEVAEALTLVHSLVGEDLLAVDEILSEDLDSEFNLVPEVARHLIGAGGKRVRPILTCLMARALGVRGTDFRELAAIVEMVHTATLFHDDVIDEARIRRGRPAAHVVYGVPVAILVGDRLYSDAFRRLLALRPRGLARDLSRAVKQVLEGEFFQLQRRGRQDLSFDQYLRLIGGKTAALFRFATKGAARNARAGKELVRAAARFGWNLGIAFQMTDDVIDVESESAATGKTRFQDLEDRKISLPLLVAMRRDEVLPGMVADYMVGGDDDEGRSGLRDEIRKRIHASGATASSRGLARRYALRAAEALAALPDNRYSRTLRQITFYVCNRNA